MQTLQEVQNSFISLGLDPKLEPFNHRTQSILVVTFSGVISLWISFIREAKDAREHMESIYIITLRISLFLSYVHTIFNTHKLFAFFESLDGFLNESEFKISIDKFLNCMK